MVKKETLRIACVYMVRNEEAMLPHNITYHKFIGVTDFFVFLDHSTDGTKSKIQTVHNLRYFEDLPYQELLRYNLNKPNLDLELMRQHFSTHSSLRQVLNVNMALEMCKIEGIDWLILLDPDELVCIDEEKIEKDSLKGFLADLDKSVGAVRFRNIEVVPTRMEVGHIFEGHLFKSYRVNGEVRGLPKSQLFDPFTNTMAPAGWFWGHSSGKLAVRPCRDSYFISSHQCYTYGETVSKDYLLHYNIYSYRQFLNKYRNFSDYPNRRNARPLRLLLRDLVNSGSFSDGFLVDYYKKNVMYSEEDIELIRSLMEDAFHEIYSVSDFFSDRAKDI